MCYISVLYILSFSFVKYHTVLYHVALYWFASYAMVSYCSVPNCSISHLIVSFSFKSYCIILALWNRSTLCNIFSYFNHNVSYYIVSYMSYHFVLHWKFCNDCYTIFWKVYPPCTYLCPGYPSEYLLFRQEPWASSAARLQKFWQDKQAQCQDPESHSAHFLSCVYIQHTVTIQI